MQILLRITGSFCPPDSEDRYHADYCTNEYCNVSGIPAIMLSDEAETETGDYGAEIPEYSQYAICRG